MPTDYTARQDTAILSAKSVVLDQVAGSLAQPGQGPATEPSGIASIYPNPLAQSGTVEMSVEVGRCTGLDWSTSPAGECGSAQVTRRRWALIRFTLEADHVTSGIYILRATDPTRASEVRRMAVVR